MDRRSKCVWILFVGAGILLSAGVSGCAFGPKALERTHGLYYEAARSVEEEQLLRNIVHLRYNETPLNLNVQAITAQYELTANVAAQPFFGVAATGTDFFGAFSRVLPDVSVGGANRPTVTLHPADSNDATQQFLTPVPLETLSLICESGWPVSTVLRLWVERLNGVPNGGMASGPSREGTLDYARFLRLAQLFQAAQDQHIASIHTEERAIQVGSPLPADAVTDRGAVEALKSGMEYRRGADGKSWVLVRPERRLVLEVSPGAENSPELMEIAELLRLVPGLSRYEVAAGPSVASDPVSHPGPPSHELRIAPRSTAQVLFYLANGVEIPPEHIGSGIVRQSVDADGRVVDGLELTRGLFEVHVCAGHKPPANAFVAVRRCGYWYYIDDHDQATKATFLLLLQVSRLNFARSSPSAAPVLTLPAGR
jgi:hypothetical protein